MALGAGLSATLGIATETVVGTPVPVTRFLEFDSETLQLKKRTFQGSGLRGGGLVKRGQRRVVIARDAGGDVMFDAPTSGLGLVLQHCLGSFTTAPVGIGGGLFRQVHNIGALAGKTFTTQVLKPDITGVLAPEAFTYPGCKITDWELSVTQNAQAKLKITIDALDELTPSNAAAPTTTAAAIIAAATSFTAVATIAAGSWVTVDVGLLAEVVQTGTPTGAGPFTIPVVSAGGFTQAHATGVYVGSATGVVAGVAATLATASYTAGINLFAFHQGKIVAGGTTSNVAGVWTNTGGQTVANVRTVSLKGKNNVKQDRWGLGQMVKSEQVDNNFRDYSAAVDVEYNGRAFYDAYAADIPLCFVLTFTTPAGGVLSFFAPVGFQGDGASPQVAGPDILIQKLNLALLDDGVNGALQAVYTSTDVAV